MENLKLSSLAVSPDNRLVVQDEDFKQLVSSIKDRGILTPLLVRKNAFHDNKASSAPEYEIVAGARRYRAAQELKLKEVPAVIREMTDAEAAEIRTIENIQRKNLGPLEEAQEYERMVKQFGNTVEAVAEKVSMTTRHIRIRLAFLGLPEEVKAAIQEGKVSGRHAEVIVRVQGDNQRKKLLKDIIEQRLSVSASESALRNYGTSLDRACFNKKDCKACQNNGAKQEDLFDKNNGDYLSGQCLNPACFKEKEAEYVQTERAKMEKKGVRVVTIAELKKQGLVIQPINSYDPKPVKNCPLCKDYGLLAGKPDRYGDGSPFKPVCFKPECYAKKTHQEPQEPQQTPEERAIADTAAQMVGRVTQTAVMEKMDLLTALRMACIVMEERGEDTIFPKKADKVALEAVLVKKAGRYAAENLEYGQLEAEDIFNWLKLNVKKDYEFTAKEIKEMEGKPGTVEPEAVLALLKKQGYKVEK